MEEEFQESDVLWPDSDRRAGEPDDVPEKHGSRRPQQKAKARTPAVRITNPPAAARSWSVGFACPTEDEDGGDGGKRCVVPPHVVVGRRIADDGVAFSVCVGNGRTLKGRDLRHVRNSILRMTGFLEI